MPGRRWTVLVGATASLSVALVGCSGDDGGEATTVAPATSTTTATTAVPTTTVPPTTSTTPPTSASTTPPTTPAPTAPPTTSLDDLKAQIAEDYESGARLLTAWLASPTTENLAERLAAIATPGSEFEQLVRQRVEDLVFVGDVVIPNDPPVNVVIVESVTVDSGTPTTGATLVVCEADNFKTVTPPERSPVGEEILSSGGELTAARFEVRMTLTSGVWLRDDFPDQYLGYYEGVDRCGPA